MRPGAEQLLGGLFSTLMTRVIPEQGTPYATGSLATMGLLMSLTAQEYERAADVRARENAALREIFRDAAAVIDDATLAQRLIEAGRARDASLRISALDHTNDELLTLLIALQTHLEARRDAPARALLKRTWAFLKTSASERSVSLPQLG